MVTGTAARIPGEVRQLPFQVRGSLQTVLTLRLLAPDDPDFFRLLLDKIAHSPDFFRNAAGALRDRELSLLTKRATAAAPRRRAPAGGSLIPDDAPTLQFNTASGPRESRMVYLPGLRLGDTVLEGLLVSVCDGCANERTKGLLGLNVMREFFVQMDYQAERMHLIPRQHDGKTNRAYDIGPTVKADVEGNPAIWLGRIRWVLLVKNRGSTAIERVVPEVQFSDGQKIRGAVIERIEPGKSGRSLVEGKTDGRDPARKSADDKNELGFTLTVAEAYW